VERILERTPKAVLLIWAGLLAMVFSGRMYSTDVLAQYEVAGSFAGLRPFMTVSGDYGWIVGGSRPGHFVPHAPGYSVLLVPAALAGEVMGLEAGKVTAGLVNCCLSLALVGFWYAAARRRYGEVPFPRFILVAVGGMALVYGRMNFDVTAAAASAMAAFHFFEKDRAVLAGALFGFSILVRTDSLLLLPLFLNRREYLMKLAAGAAPFLLLLLSANWYRFGSPFLDGHSQDPAIAIEPFRGGIPGLLLSPGKGLLYYAPLCILALFHQEDRRLWVPFVLSLVFHGMLHDWTGGTGWEPRFLFTSLPFLLMPLCRKGAAGRLFLPVALAGLAVALPALWSNPGHIEQAAGADLFDDPSRQAVIWEFSSSPLFLAFGRLFRGAPDILGTYAAGPAGIPRWAGAALQLTAGLSLAAAGIWSLRRRGSPAGGGS